MIVVQYYWKSKCIQLYRKGERSETRMNSPYLLFFSLLPPTLATLPDIA